MRLACPEVSPRDYGQEPRGFILDFPAAVCHQTQVGKKVLVPNICQVFRVVTWIDFPDSVLDLIFCVVYLTVESFWSSFFEMLPYSVSLLSCQGSRSLHFFVQTTGLAAAGI